MATVLRSPSPSAVRDQYGAASRSPGVSLTEVLAPPLAGEAATAVVAFVGLTAGAPAGVAAWIDGLADFDAAMKEEVEPGSTLRATIRHYFDNGGVRCLVVGTGSLHGPLRNDAVAQIEALSSEDLIAAVLDHPDVTLVAAPELATLAAEDKQSLFRAWQKWLSACAARRNRFCLLDAPRELSDATAMLGELSKSPSEWTQAGAAYWPHLVTDYSAEKPEAGRGGADRAGFVIVPPCGAVAAAIQRTDMERGIWKAPANVRLAHVISPETVIRGDDPVFRHDGSSFNLIRPFAGRGTRIWGCRTLSETQHWRYVQVRRLVSYVEANLEEIARFAVFEPNDEVTWIKLKGLMRAWLRRLWLRGGLLGAQEDEAFSIDVGLGDSMTHDDIVKGRMVVGIGLSVLQPAEFIDVTLVLNLTGSALVAAGDRLTLSEVS